MNANYDKLQTEAMVFIFHSNIEFESNALVTGNNE